MKFMMQMSVCALATLAISACSSGGGSDSPSTGNAVGAGFKAVDSAMSGVSAVIPNTAPAFRLTNTFQPKTGTTSPNNIWDGTGWMADPRCSGGASDPHCSTGSVTLKYYMGFMFDANQTRDNGSDINVFGRVKSALKHACAIGTLLGGSSLPAAGSYSITFGPSQNSTLETYCNFTSDDLTNLNGQTITATVTATTDATYYDRLVTMSMGSQSMRFLLRVNSTNVNILASESDTSNWSRTTLSLDRSTGKITTEYVSRSSGTNGGGEWHRLFWDPVNDDAAVVGSSYDFQTPKNQLLYAVKGAPNNSSAEVAYSVGVVGFGLTTADSGASTTNLNHYKACVNPNNGSISTDNSLSCAGSITGTDTSGTLSTTVFADLQTALATDGSKLTDSSVVGEDDSVPFTTSSNIFSAGVPTGP